MDGNSTERRISVDAFVSAGKDLFPLILDIEKLLHMHDISSVQFISDVLSTDSRVEQFNIIIRLLSDIRDTEIMEVQAGNNIEFTDKCDIDLPEPIIKRHLIKYNSAEAWKYDNKDDEDE